VHATAPLVASPAHGSNSSTALDEVYIDKVYKHTKSSKIVYTLILSRSTENAYVNVSCTCTYYFLKTFCIFCQEKVHICILSFGEKYMYILNRLRSTYVQACLKYELSVNIYLARRSSRLLNNNIHVYTNIYKYIHT